MSSPAHLSVQYVLFCGVELTSFWYTAVPEWKDNPSMETVYCMNIIIVILNVLYRICTSKNRLLFQEGYVESYILVTEQCTF